MSEKETPLRLSEQPVSALHHPQSKEVLPGVQMEPPVLQFPLALVLSRQLCPLCILPSGKYIIEPVHLQAEEEL